MKNKKLIMTVVVIIFILPLIGVSYVSAEVPEDALSLAAKVGKMFSEHQKNKGRTTDIYAVGKNTTITQQDIDKATEFYIIAGMVKDEAKIKAEEYIFGREALYHKAIQEGYQVTDEEVRQYIEECKSAIEELGNRDEIETMIAQYDSEEDYWDEQFIVYQKNLPSQKYVQALEKEFWNNKKEKYYGSPEKNDEEWAEYFHTFKNNLIAKEDYQIVEQ